MATTRKGWRRIVVDGENFRWTVRRKASYWDYIADAPMRFTVENAAGGLLTVTLNRPRMDSWFHAASEPNLRPVTPREVADLIRGAKRQGWNTTEKTKPRALSVLVDKVKLSRSFDDGEQI